MVKTYAKTLSKEAIIQINKQFSDGFARDEGALDYIVWRVAETRGIDRKAGRLLLEIARRHPFNDGNKRTAYESMNAFLQLNGKELSVGNDSKFNVVIWTIKKKVSLNQIVIWISNHTRR